MSDRTFIRLMTATLIAGVPYLSFVFICFW